MRRAHVVGFNPRYGVKRIGRAGVIVLFTLLGACGGDSGTTTTPTATPGPAPAPVVTALGQANGTAITQAIDANGGTLSAAGITVTVPAGAFDATVNVTLQPVTDALNGSGQSVALSSGAPWKKGLTITFPLDSNGVDPSTLDLAIQVADGSWRVLSSPTVDGASHTVSAVLPELKAAGRSAPSAATRKTAQAGPSASAVGPVGISKIASVFLRPINPTVRPGQTVDLVPYSAKYDQDLFEVCVNAEVGIGDACLSLGLAVIKPLVIPNQQEGFDTTWSVEGVVGGSSATGTISPRADAGATYAAATSPGNYGVQFRSERRPGFNGRGIGGAATAVVRLYVDQFPQQYTASIHVSGTDSDGNSFEGRQTLTLDKGSEFLNDGGYRVYADYQGLASVQVTATYVGCESVTAAVPVRFLLATGKPFLVDDLTTDYAMGANAEATVLASAQCGAQTMQVPVVFDFLTQCDFVTVDPAKDVLQQLSSNLTSLAGRKILTCDNGGTSVTWDTDWVVTAVAPPPK